MKILLLTQFFSQTRGGGEYVFNLLAKELAKNDHKVWVITNKIKNEEYHEYENIKLIFVAPTLEYKGGLPPGFSDNIRYVFNAINKGREIIKKEKIDLIHSNNFAPSLTGSILSTITRKPHITTIHDVFSLCGKNYWKKWGSQSNVSRINVVLAPFFEKLMIKFRHKCIHTVSEASKDDLVKFGAKKPIYVIHNAVEDEDNSESSNLNPFQFVNVGRLVFYKNLEIVIKAISILKKSESKIKLVIVGEVPHKNALQDLVRELDLEANVEFAGYVSHDKKMSIISESTAMVFPSLCEGFGLVMLEAFSQKRPVLVSNVRPMSDIIEDEKTGFVLDPYDENNWAEKMLYCVKNSQDIDKMGDNGNSLLRESFNKTSMFEKLIQMYKEQIL